MTVKDEALSEVAGELRLQRVVLEHRGDDLVARVTATISTRRRCDEHEWVVDTLALETFPAFRRAILKRYGILCGCDNIETERPCLRQGQWIEMVDLAGGGQ